jgi:DNA-binding NarL/FixJ family response regulator
MNTQIEALVIARPSRFRESLHLLLASMSLIEKIHLADDIESALKITAVPTVVIVDVEVGDLCLPAAIARIKTAWPQARLVVLVEDELEYQAAQSAGGDVLLRKGFPAAKFIEAVETLLTK